MLGTIIPMESPHEAVKRLFPSADEEELHSILMCCTALPFCSVEHAIGQLEEYSVKASTPGHAVTLAHQEMDRVWEETREERERLQNADL